jgi:hypothetical protein
LSIVLNRQSDGLRLVNQADVDVLSIFCVFLSVGQALLDGPVKSLAGDWRQIEGAANQLKAHIQAGQAVEALRQRGQGLRQGLVRLRRLAHDAYGMADLFQGGLGFRAADLNRP